VIEHEWKNVTKEEEKKGLIKSFFCEKKTSILQDDFDRIQWCILLEMYQRLEH